MRAIFVGASTTTIATARMLLERDHEVVIIEQDKERIEALAAMLDCGFPHGDMGSLNPKIEVIKPQTMGE